MNTARPMHRLARAGLLRLALLGMLLRIAVPAGYMPAALADGWYLQLCPDGLSAAAMVALFGEGHRHHGVGVGTGHAAATPAAPTGGDSGHAHHHHHAHPEATADAPSPAAEALTNTAAWSPDAGIFNCDLGAGLAAALVEDGAAPSPALAPPSVFVAAAPADRVVAATRLLPPSRGPPARV